MNGKHSEGTCKTTRKQDKCFPQCEWHGKKLAARGSTECIIAQNNEGGKKYSKDYEVCHQINPEPEYFGVAYHNRLPLPSCRFHLLDLFSWQHIFRIVVKRADDNTNDRANKAKKSKPENVPHNGKSEK